MKKIRIISIMDKKCRAQNRDNINKDGDHWTF